MALAKMLVNRANRTGFVKWELSDSQRRIPILERQKGKYQLKMVSVKSKYLSNRWPCKGTDNTKPLSLVSIWSKTATFSWSDFLVSIHWNLNFIPHSAVVKDSNWYELHHPSFAMFWIVVFTQILFLFQISLSHFEDPIGTDSWQQHIKTLYSKPWQKYIDAFLEKKGWKNIHQFTYNFFENNKNKIKSCHSCEIPPIPLTWKTTSNYKFAF